MGERLRCRQCGQDFVSIVATDGQWSMEERNAYFLAGSLSAVSVAVDQQEDTGVDERPLWILVAVNDVNPESEVDIAFMERLLDSGARVLLDSGVFWLTNRHKRAHGITMDKALGLHPDEIDDFEWLWDRYLKLHALFGDRLWGMIELDQGGAVRKRETRKRLHDLGIYPIPVYHPLNDGAEYFDELAESTDRMCLGNVVQANSKTRERLLMALYERKRAYPHLWVHLLGYSMNEWLHAAPVESCDSSSWLTIIRWAASARERSMLKNFSAFPTNMRYDYEAAGDAPGGRDRSIAMASAAWRFNHLNWLDHLNNLEEVLGTNEFR
jgi:hypothetical protein